MSFDYINRRDFFQYLVLIGSSFLGLTSASKATTSQAIKIASLELVDSLGESCEGLESYYSRNDKEYSGFVIVRMSKGLPELQNVDNLAELTEKLQLSKFKKILHEFKLMNSRRVVRSLPTEEILKLEKKLNTQQFANPIRSLTRYWRIDVRHHEDKDQLVSLFNELQEVDLAYLELSASDLIVRKSADSHTDKQGYLDAAPIGIDARWAWKHPSGKGQGMRFIDLEQGWFLDHEDLPTTNSSLIYGDNRDGINGYKGDHGTAILGEVVAVHNHIGVAGIAPKASVQVASHYDAATDTNGHVADAIVASIDKLSSGDVLLIEVCRDRDWLPTEVDDADFDAIQLAKGHGIIVVEAAGNGSQNLDNYADSVYGKVLNRNHIAFRDSGAIVVSGAKSALASNGKSHNHKLLCNWGSRIDCYAWAENVVSCGYGNLGTSTEKHHSYTKTFGGTSSAAPMIAGAALILQSISEAEIGRCLSPNEMRDLLADTMTGTPQGISDRRIGVMPDLRAIIERFSR